MMLEVEKRCVGVLKHWLETEAQFKGRNDEDFLLIFARGCKNDAEKAKKKLIKYYDNRKRLPEWWAKRDVEVLQPIISHRVMTVLIDKEVQLPSMAIAKLSRVREDSSLFDKYMQLNSIAIELALRRRNCQLNGLVWIIDMTDYPLWIYSKILYPTMIYNVLHSLTLATPLRLKGVHVLNFPLIGRAIWQMMKAMLPVKIRKRIYLYGSDWSALKNNVDNRLLPQEYGGSNGSIEQHDQMYIQEIHEFAVYLKNDEKYGFQ